MKTRFFSFAVALFFMSSGIVNAYDAELYQKWQESYHDSVDVVINLRLVEIKSSKTNTIMSAVLLPTICQVVYEVQSVESQPTSLKILPGDLLLLKYGCRSHDGSYRGPTRSFPWIKKTGKLYQGEIRSAYLKKKRKRRWVIKNKDKVFKPLPS